MISENISLLWDSQNTPFQSRINWSVNSWIIRIGIYWDLTHNLLRLDLYSLSLEVVCNKKIKPVTQPSKPGKSYYMDQLDCTIGVASLFLIWIARFPTLLKDCYLLRFYILSLWLCYYQLHFPLISLYFSASGSKVQVKYVFFSPMEGVDDKMYNFLWTS